MNPFNDLQIGPENVIIQVAESLEAAAEPRRNLFQRCTHIEKNYSVRSNRADTVFKSVFPPEMMMPTCLFLNTSDADKTAANGTAPEGSTMIFIRSHISLNAYTISSSSTLIILSTSF